MNSQGLIEARYDPNQIKITWPFCSLFIFVGRESPGDLMTWFRAVKASMQWGCECYCVLSTTMKNPHFHWLIH